MSEFQKGDRVLHGLRDGQLIQVIGIVGEVASGGSVYVRWPSGSALWYDPSELDHEPVRQDWDKALNDSFSGAATETRTTSSTGAEKGVKAEAFSLLPVQALEKVARHYRVGAEKYAAHNWRAGYEWSKSYDALQRHAHAFWRGEDMDAETGSAHMAAVAFHALALLTFMDEQPGFDDRYRASSAGFIL